MRARPLFASTRLFALVAPLSLMHPSSGAASSGSGAQPQAQSQQSTPTPLKKIDLKKLERAEPTSRFTVLPQAGGPMVRDNTTGRVWERVPATTKREWSAAKSACDGKELGGKTDWRLPRVEEVEALLAGPVEAPLPAGHPFTVAAENYWTSTEGSGTAANSVLAINGNTFANPKTTTFASWCVRGGGNTAYPNSNPRFQVVDDTVKDLQTGRVWQRQAVGQSDWFGARSTCRSRGADWRLALREELVGLLDMNAPESPKLPVGHPFLNTWAPYDTQQLWTLASTSATHTATVRFSDGAVASAAKSGTASARCIKMDPTAAWPAGKVGRFQLTLGDRAVLDRETRLLWERAPVVSGVQYPDAAAMCATLTIGGVTGWRLPTLPEIRTLLDLGVTSGVKLPPGHPFVGIAPADYWTTTPHSSDMKTLDLQSGSDGHMSQMGGHLQSWCVRAEP